MSAAREKDQADFDLERFVDMFDEAMTSQDPRVMDALRGLMMMVTLTRPESRDAGIIDRHRGPLRRLYEDIGHLNNRLGRVEEQLRQAERSQHRVDYNYKYDYPYEKFSMQRAAEMEAKIDQDLLNTLKMNSVAKVKGLLDK